MGRGLRSTLGYWSGSDCYPSKSALWVSVVGLPRSGGTRGLLRRAWFAFLHYLKQTPDPNALSRWVQLLTIAIVTVMVRYAVKQDLSFFWDPMAGQSPTDIHELGGVQCFYLLESLASWLAALVGGLTFWKTIAQSMYDRYVRTKSVGAGEQAAGTGWFHRWLRAARDWDASPFVERVGGWVLLICVLMNILAIRSLVTATGGAFESPFTPLLAAPPVFGVFMAQSPKLNFWLIVVGTMFEIACLDMAQPLEFGLDPFRQVGHHPQWPAYFLPVAALTGIAAILGLVGFIARDHQSSDGGGSIQDAPGPPTADP